MVFLGFEALTGAHSDSVPFGRLPDFQTPLLPGQAEFACQELRKKGRLSPVPWSGSGFFVRDCAEGDKDRASGRLEGGQRTLGHRPGQGTGLFGTFCMAKSAYSQRTMMPSNQLGMQQ